MFIVCNGYITVYWNLIINSNINYCRVIKYYALYVDVKYYCKGVKYYALTDIYSFTNLFTGAIRNKKMNQFKQRFRRDCDLLVVEDVQFLGGKKATQPLAQRRFPAKT